MRLFILKYLGVDISECESCLKLEELYEDSKRLREFEIEDIKSGVYRAVVSAFGGDNR